MFKFLKEKLTSWIKKEPEKEAKKERKAEGKIKKVQKEKSKKERKKERKSGKKIKQIEQLEEIEEELISTPTGETNKFQESIAQTPAIVEQDTIEETEQPEGEKEEKVGFFAKLKRKLSTSVLEQDQFDEIFQELEIILLENNVAFEVVQKIHDSLSKDLVNISVKKDKVEETIKESLKEAILSVLIESEDVIKKIEKSLETYTILFFGINGSGKTTSIAKLAYLLKQKGISCVLGAADTFRAASIEQLEEHAKKIGVPIVKGNYGSDPAAVAFDTIKYAKKHKIQAVLIDTAGRMYTNINLLREMEKIVKVSQPQLKIFVGESITGNDAVEQAKTFNDAIGMDGIILTKADVDEKAGTILSVSYITSKPIFFLGTGQNYEDIKSFKKHDVLKGLGLE